MSHVNGHNHEPGHHLLCSRSAFVCDAVLVSLSLVHSSLRSGAVHHLAAALRRGIAAELDLSHTRLGDDKFHLLSAGLRDCKLRKLK